MLCKTLGSSSSAVTGKCLDFCRIYRYGLWCSACPNITPMMQDVNTVVTVRAACMGRFEFRWHFVDRSCNSLVHVWREGCSMRPSVLHHFGTAVALHNRWLLHMMSLLSFVVFACLSLRALFVHLHSPACLSLSKLAVYWQLPIFEILPNNGLAAIREVVYILCAIFCSTYMFLFWEHAFFIYIFDMPNFFLCIECAATENWSSDQNCSVRNK